MKRAIQCIVIIGMMAAVSVALADEPSGRIGANGSRLQGISLNGWRLQGAGVNGFPQQSEGLRGGEPQTVRRSGWPSPRTCALGELHDGADVTSASDRRDAGPQIAVPAELPSTGVRLTSVRAHRGRLVY